MGQQSDASFDRRTVEDWIERARDGRIALADFQRSFVWPPKKAAGYINAILRGRPVGVYLILNSAPSPQFSPRRFSNMDTPLDRVKELVLDGQQRLSSLLHVLYGHRSSRFFIEVEDFAAEMLTAKRVVAYTQSSTEAQRMAEPVVAYRSNHIPIDVLRRPDRDGENSPLTRWCSDVVDVVDAFENYEQKSQFEKKISQFANDFFFQRYLYFYRLSEETSRADATEIFVETNTSSVQINTFDEVVAKVRGREDQDFRKMIGKARHDSDVLRYFFPGDEEKAIPTIGTWLLKLGCLHAGVPPKRGRYEEGGQHLFDRKDEDDDGLPANFRDALVDVEWVLKRVSDMGSPSRSTLPSWPPVHVLAAIRSRYLGIDDPEEANAARRLIDAYYWRSLFTNRYERQADDRLFEDFEELSNVLEGEAMVGTMRIFNKQHHPLRHTEWLMESTGWIGQSRIGKALVAAVLASEPTPVDWITGEPLRATHIRQLEQNRNLDRHHVFPKKVLEVAGVPVPEMNNGLNGVVLDKRTNRRFWRYSPDEYVANVTKKKGITKAELRKRIEGHRVPYGEMVNVNDEMDVRYSKFRAQRAELLAEMIEQLAQLPK